MTWIPEVDIRVGVCIRRRPSSGRAH
jgi:hypothetical protein